MAPTRRGPPVLVGWAIWAIHPSRSGPIGSNRVQSGRQPDLPGRNKSKPDMDLGRPLGSNRQIGWLKGEASPTSGMGPGKSGIFPGTLSYPICRLDAIDGNKSNASLDFRLEVESGSPPDLTRLDPIGRGRLRVGIEFLPFLRTSLGRKVAAPTRVAERADGQELDLPGRPVPREPRPNRSGVAGDLRDPRSPIGSNRGVDPTRLVSATIRMSSDYGSRAGPIGKSGWRRTIGGTAGPLEICSRSRSGISAIPTDSPT
jgi:hypothetical protein